LLIYACPGQGSQSEGFLKPWIEAYPDLTLKLAELSKACGRDLVRLGTEASEEEIKDTANAQRLIVGASIAIARIALTTKTPVGVLGHSVGEFAAAAIAGVLSDEEAIELVGIRADAMATAAAMQPTSMAAILGGEESEVLSKIESLDLEPANFNGASQIVAAGLKSQIAQLVAEPPEKAKVIELKVAGAFHTRFMQSAVEEVRSAAAKLSPSNPKMKLWSNADGTLVQSGQAFLDSLVSQIARPVRWDKCMASFNQEGVLVVELPPAGALAGLIKRGAPLASAVALKSVSDLEKVS
jgi:[acyl-carrier-protein] S-malonyltransferase